MAPDRRQAGAHVQVLLSTYNGARYLVPLLDSLLDQDYPRLSVLVRDDGSTDETRTVLDDYAQGNRVAVRCEENVGVVRSFLRLLELSDPGASYLAFCDQDDVWDRDKISRAVSLLSADPNDGATMYCGRVRITDERLRPIALSRIPRRPLTLRNALVQNVAVGCTVVLNTAAKQLILARRPRHALMHDWWSYIVVSAFGRVLYDPEPKVSYRQHATNVIGTRVGFLADWMARADRFRKSGHLLAVRTQAEDFWALFGADLSASPREVAERFISRARRPSSRLWYAVRPDVYRQSLLDDLVMRALMLCNRL